MHSATKYVRAVADTLREAGSRILIPAFTAESSETATKRDGSVVTETDLQCQAFIRQHLYALDPDIRFLGEEMTEDEQRACLEHGGRFWCVDPLDGTSNFTASFPCFASAVALIEDGRAVLACIHDPVRGETFEAAAGDGARLNGIPIRTSGGTTQRDPEAHALQGCVGFIDFKRLPGPLQANLAAGRAYRSQRNIGSCALEWAWLAAGRGQFIVHGGQKLWDFSAGSLIADEAGATVTDLAGRPLAHAGHLVSSIVAGADAAIHADLLATIRVGHA